MSLQPPQRPRVATGSLLYTPALITTSPSSSTDASVSPLLPSYLPGSSASRPTMSRHSTAHSISAIPYSTAGSPYLTPQGSTANVYQATPRRLLMPTVWITKPGLYPSPRVPSTKSSPGKLARSRAGSTAASVYTPSPDPNAPLPPPKVDWIGNGARFEVIEDQIVLEGYQIYAVEKWITERIRPVVVLTVYTGDPSHKIDVTALSPMASLSKPEVNYEWDKAIRHLQKDRARPKEVGGDIIMVTSLANFPSDNTIVHIPKGNFLDVREQLYTNINLLRMGCSGRSALTLEEPSETTKDRFISAYRIPDKALVRSHSLFNAIVIELVKLIQAGLSLCGFFDLAREERNGLLCDVTCDGLRKWITDIGKPLLDLYPLERSADPVMVSALFSTIITIRNKLHAMGHIVPKDPLIDPCNFLKSLGAFSSMKLHSHGHSLSLPHNPVLNHSTIPSLPSSATPVFLNLSTINLVNAAYDKTKQNEGYKVHRVLINKLDDLATDLRTNPDQASGKSLWGGASSQNPTIDISKFVQVVTGSSKDGTPSLRYLWSGRPSEVTRKRNEKEAVWSEGEEKELIGKDHKGRDKEREKERLSEPQIKSSDDEAGDGRAWQGKVQRKLEHWTVLGRGKKMSLDLTNKGKSGFSEHQIQVTSGKSSQVPSIVMSRELNDEDDVVSSGRTSPVSDNHVHIHNVLGMVDACADRSTGDLLEYDRRVSEFNRRNPTAKPYSPMRIVSWADPKSTKHMLGEDVNHQERYRNRPMSKTSDRPDNASENSLANIDEFYGAKRPRPRKLDRRRSFDDAEALRGTRLLPVDYMHIDVELCGQHLIMRRREQHLANVISCLHALTASLSSSNTALRSDYTSQKEAMEACSSRTDVLQDIEAAQARADAMTLETNALAYESAQFLIDDLWHMAATPRQRVLAMRDSLFGTGRRLPQGVNGAHGRFNRVQRTLDGNQRLVDSQGRTEEEAEEEEGLPGAVQYVQEDEGDVVEHAGLKPTWLLRMFNYWGSKWGSTSTNKKTDGQVGQEAQETQELPQADVMSRAQTMASATSGVEMRSALLRNHTL